MLAVSVTVAIGAGIAVFQHFSVDLPEYQQLAAYEPPTTTRFHAGDGRLLAEYAVQHRLFVPIEVIAEPVKQAFLAAEDKKFYSHPGVDVVGILRAVGTNVSRVLTGRRPVGGSTITQQVAKNFLLTNEVSVTRKIKEALLAFRIERALSKDRILELYLNEIYLGYGSYGVAAAALNYFNKSLDDLTVAEAAFLAALPKAPNNYNPVTRPDAAKGRRNWVIQRMLEDGRITPEVARAAQAEPLEVRRRDETEYVTAQWYAEEVRRRLVGRFGEAALYEGGLSVRTSLNPILQRTADKALRAGLRTYDRRHGWRGPITRIQAGAGWETALQTVERPAGLDDWKLAVVLKVESGSATIGLADGSTGSIPFGEMKWARPWRPDQRVGPAPGSAGDVLAVGDVVAVSRVHDDPQGREKYDDWSTFALEQVPEVDGAIVAMDPHTGRVLAITGGYSYDRSEFNRATQADRQPGSSFKPFVYLTALENGYTPATVILDAPLVVDQGPGLGLWRPKNYSGRFYGPAPMRIGIEQSRNLMTVRLAQAVGIGKVAETAERFGIFDRMPRVLSMSLGAGETTLLELTAAYSMLANGGRKITPSLIDRVQNRQGRTIYKHDARECAGCTGPQAAHESVPQLLDDREQLASPASVYQMVSMLQGVVERGTGSRVRMPGKPLAGKTGTTNDSFDAWFMGFSSRLAVGVFVGFDNPRTLGPGETGSSVASPIFRDFMQDALEEIPATPFPVPSGVRLVRVSRSSGLPPTMDDNDVIYEAFKPGTEPQRYAPVIGGDIIRPDEPYGHLNAPYGRPGDPYGSVSRGGQQPQRPYSSGGGAPPSLGGLY